MSASLPADVANALQVLQKYELKESEAALKKAVGLEEKNVSNEFTQFKANEQDSPERFVEYFESLLLFLDTVPDAHRVELSGLLYPLFVQMYLRLVSGQRQKEAEAFMEAFREFQEDYYQDDIQVLASITELEHICTNPLIDCFKSGNFVVSIPMESYAYLKQFLNEKGLHTIQSVLKDQLTVEVFDGPPRSKAQLDCRRGAFFGESKRDINRELMYYGIFRSSDVREAQEADRRDDDEDDELTPSKKKKKDKPISSVSRVGQSGKKADTNAPPVDRIPLPKLTSQYLESRQTFAHEISQILKSTTAQQRNLSSVLYTVCNAQTGESAMAIRRGGVHCMAFDESATMMGAGFATGRVRIWSLGAESLRLLLSPEKLATLDKDDAWIRTKMLHDENDEAHPSRDLQGHLDAVNGLSFSPDKQFILSASSDGSVRLWSTLMWGGAVSVWRDHLLPIWAVQWAPNYGHYYVTGGADRTARLYAVDHAPNALRIFTGHKSDVTSVVFHPNINYLATGSADRAVRIFDVKSGKLVRLLSGHKGSVQSLAFSPCGRFLASGGWGGAVCLWDMANGAQIGQLGGYNLTADSPSTAQMLTGPVVSLEFCPGASGLLASGSLEGAIRLWETGTGKISSHGLMSAYNEVRTTSVSQSTAVLYGGASGEEVTKACLKDAFYTRKTGVLAMKFLHPYLLLAAGPYNQC